MSMIKQKKSDNQDFEVILDGVDLRKKAIGLSKLRTGKAAVEAVYRLFDDSVTKFKSITENTSKQNTQDYPIAVYELANTYYEKALVMRAIGSVEGGVLNHYPTIDTALNTLERIPEKDMNADMNRLWALILIEKSKQKTEQNKLSESESMLITALERLIASHKQKQDDENTIKYLDDVLNSLTEGKKDRKRYGKAIYHFCGEFAKEGRHGGWRTRFFVIDDATITYYKSKKDWQTTSVGGKAKAYGTIQLAEIRDVSFHGSGTCFYIREASRPSKLKDSKCIHLHTSDRIYNLLTVPVFSAEAEYNDSTQVLKKVLRNYKIKRDAKKIVKAKANLSFAYEFQKELKTEVKVKGNIIKRNSILKGSETKRMQRSASNAPRPPMKKAVSWRDETAYGELINIIPRENSQFPEEDWSDKEVSDDDDDFDPPPPYVPKKMVIQESPRGSSKSFNLPQLKEELNHMDADEQMAMVKEIFKEYEKEGKLRKLFQLLVQEDPAAYILKLSSVDNFEIAKFGMLQKAATYIAAKKQQ